MEGRKASSPPGGGRSRQVWLLRGGVLAVALIVAVVAWVSTQGDDGEPSAQTERTMRVVSEGELADAAAVLGWPIYWAGPMDGVELELEELEEGGVRVRYVPEDEAGESPAEVLTIGSYPLADPVGALESFSRRPGAIVREGVAGLEAFSSEEAPNSVYFADPSAGVQVEVYDPAPEEAMSLVLSGKVEPVE